MAETKSGRPAAEQQSEQGLARQPEGGGLRRRESSGWFSNPFELMDRMADEMDRMFDRMSREVGFPRSSRLSRAMSGSPGRGGLWSPRIDAFQKDDTFVVRADLPGMKKDDIEVGLTDDAITIRGERRQEQRDEHEGYWRVEREYGQFHRAIPLPEGAIADSAEASFRDGVLEITMRAAPQAANRGRRLDIKESSTGEGKR